MTPWIQVYANLHTHPKTYRLAGLLRLRSTAAAPNTIATGLLTNLWCWAAVNVPDGELTMVPHQCLADGAGWKLDPEVFFDGLVTAGFIDCTPDGSACLHDWLDYASLLLEQEDNRKKKTRERVQRYRAKQKSGAVCNVQSNVTVTPGNASTIPDRTIPNLTERKEAKESLPPAALQLDRELYRQIHGREPNW